MTRFSIRDVFWLTLVVGLSLGWWVDHQAQRQMIVRIARGIWIDCSDTILLVSDARAIEFAESVSASLTSQQSK